MNAYSFLGVVQNGRFVVRVFEVATSESFRLTQFAPHSTQSPESMEISLLPYDGLALLVRGISQGEWIYSASIAERGSEMLSLLVQAVFRTPMTADQYHVKFSTG